MGEGKHTPGPWDLRDDNKRITVGCGLVEGPNGYDVAEVYNDDCDRDEAWANARLIAAAPELLEAALAYLDAHDGATGTVYVVKQMREAYAKATGAAS